MKTTIQTRAGELELTRHRVGPRPALPGRVAARLIHQCAASKGAVTALRRLLEAAFGRWNTHRLSDDDVVDTISRLLVSNQLCAFGGFANGSAAGAWLGAPVTARTEVEPEQPVLEVSRRRASDDGDEAPPPPPREPDPDEAADRAWAQALDAHPQAAALVAAAAQGVPFCAECERARREREQRRGAGVAGGTDAAHGDDAGGAS